MFHALVSNKRSYFRDDLLGVLGLHPPDSAWFGVPPLSNTKTSDGVKVSGSFIFYTSLLR